MQESIFNILADKGAVFAVLGIAVYYLHSQNSKLSDKQDQMHREMIGLVFDELKKTQEVIMQNTAAFEKMAEYLRDVKNYKS